MTRGPYGPVRTREKAKAVASLPGHAPGPEPTSSAGPSDAVQRSHGQQMAMVDDRDVGTSPRRRKHQQHRWMDGSESAHRRRPFVRGGTDGAAAAVPLLVWVRLNRSPRLVHPGDSATPGPGPSSHVCRVLPGPLRCDAQSASELRDSSADTPRKPGAPPAPRSACRRGGPAPGSPSGGPHGVAYRRFRTTREPPRARAHRCSPRAQPARRPPHGVRRPGRSRGRSDRPDRR